MKFLQKCIVLLTIFLGCQAANSFAQNVTIYYDNSVTGWANVNIHYWSDPSTNWPGVALTKITDTVWEYTFPSDVSGLDGFLFCDGSGSGDENQTADCKQVPLDGHIYLGHGGAKGKVSDEGLYEPGGDNPQKPVVVADPVSGTRFDDSITVTLTVSPDATIYYTVSGDEPSEASSVYSAPLTFTESTTLKTYAVTPEGGSRSQTFTYKKRVPLPPSGSNVITDYYKVNPDGKSGSNRTIDMNFQRTGDNRMCEAVGALSHWTDDDLIAQGVARDIASAIKGKHEYPCNDSYAIYAAYDSENLYLGVQYVYSVWDIYGDGILWNGAAKPYNMDGRLMIAFDLDPEKSFAGVLANGNTIWDADGQYNKFDNGTDCIWLGSSKSTVGTPGLFFPDANGNASYDSPYCVSITAPFYGCADGLLSCIENIWGQEKFEYDPEDLLGNEGFVDIRGLANDDQHTFYEWKFPLDKLGITEDYIKNEGIGVMVIDTYGQGAIGSTPYDPTVLDNADVSYSKDPSTSNEKEDLDIFTYAHARIGKMGTTAVRDIISVEDAEPAAPVYYNLQGVKVANPQSGIFIEVRGNKITKKVVK